MQTFTKMEKSEYLHYKPALPTVHTLAQAQAIERHDLRIKKRVSFKYFAFSNIIFFEAAFHETVCFQFWVQIEERERGFLDKGIMIKSLWSFSKFVRSCRSNYLKR